MLTHISTSGASETACNVNKGRTPEVSSSNSSCFQVSIYSFNKHLLKYFFCSRLSRDGSDARNIEQERFRVFSSMLTPADNSSWYLGSLQNVVLHCGDIWKIPTQSLRLKVNASMKPSLILQGGALPFWALLYLFCYIIIVNQFPL